MMLVKEYYLGKDKKMYVVFMDLKKAHDKVDRRIISVVNMWCVCGLLLKRIQAFNRDNACVRVG